MDYPSKKSTVATLAVALVAMLAIGGAAATLTFDNETTNTASTSDLVGGETIKSLDSSTDNKTIEVQAGNATTAGDGDSFSTYVIINDSDHPNDGRVAFEDQSTSWTATDQTNGHYEANFSHAQLFSEVERDINENVSVDVKVVFDEGGTEEESSTITVTAANGDTHAVDVITESDLNNSEDVSVTSNDGYLGLFAKDYASVAGTESINGSATTVRVVMANENVSQRFTDSYDAGSYDTGGLLTQTTIMTGDDLSRMFVDEAGSGLDSGATYAVYDESPEYGAHPHIEITPGDSYSDASSLDYSVESTEMSFWRTLNAFGLDAALEVGP